ncbi:hypothetical protein E2C01_068505 [Portunus trituberculatus]|uniref:Uncharacterized protein n=1 Tax=Portunus trituberculatus TaxID=210409 RepID=A0A5B7HWN2_PORTR|nr:hypothetical protein [Portunus trituberculatus]
MAAGKSRCQPVPPRPHPTLTHQPSLAFLSLPHTFQISAEPNVDIRFTFAELKPTSNEELGEGKSRCK